MVEFTPNDEWCGASLHYSFVLLNNYKNIATIPIENITLFDSNKLKFHNFLIFIL
jgi:hypothetical protein